METWLILLIVIIIIAILFIVWYFLLGGGTTPCNLTTEEWTTIKNGSSVRETYMGYKINVYKQVDHTFRFWTLFPSTNPDEQGKMVYYYAQSVGMLKGIIDMSETLNFQCEIG